MPFRILKWDDDYVAALPDKDAYRKDKSKYGEVAFKLKTLPSNSWTFPLVTGHKYRIHWADGLDYERMQLTLSERWRPTDKNIYLIHNFTDVRQAIDFVVDGEKIENNTIGANEADWSFGQNVVYNETAIRDTHFIVNGKGQTTPVQERKLVMTGHRCIYDCVEKIVEVELGAEKLWSDPKSWPSEECPKEGEDVHVESGMNIIFDLDESPIFKLIRINGKVTFKKDKDSHLRAKHIFVRAGELEIGTKEEPFEHKATITLFGEKNC